MECLFFFSLLTVIPLEKITLSNCLSYYCPWNWQCCEIKNLTFFSKTEIEGKYSNEDTYNNDKCLKGDFPMFFKTFYAATKNTDFTGPYI